MKELPNAPQPTEQQLKEADAQITAARTVRDLGEIYFPCSFLGDPGAVHEIALGVNLAYTTYVNAKPVKEGQNYPTNQELTEIIAAWIQILETEKAKGARKIIWRAYPYVKEFSQDNFRLATIRWRCLFLY